MLGPSMLLLLTSFIGCLAALYVYDWVHDDHDWGMWPDIDWNWLKRLFMPEIWLGLGAYGLALTSFNAVMVTAAGMVKGQWTSAAIEGLLTMFLGLLSVAAFASAAWLWWTKGPGRSAYLPFVLTIVWATTAGYLLYVGAMAGWKGDFAWGIFNALGAAASAAFALVPLGAVIWAKRAQRKLARAKKDKK